MGTKSSKTANIDKNIAKQINQQAKENKLKILLLGTALTGKSTIFKSLRFLKDDKGPEPAVLSENLGAVRSNCVYTMLTLLRHSHRLYDANNDNNKPDPQFSKCFIDLSDDNTKKNVECIFGYQNLDESVLKAMDDSELKKLGQCIQYLWGLHGIKETFKIGQTGRKFSIPDNMDFFFNKIDKIFQKDYSLATSNEDYLKTRVRTTGLIDMYYPVGNNIFTIRDVGGVRNERRKWIHSFDAVNSILYTVSLDHYSKVLFEDESQNALIESIQLFQQICKNVFFKNTAISVVFTKPDTFRYNLQYASLKVCFDDYNDRDFNGKIKNKKDFKSNVRMSQAAMSIVFKGINIQIDHDVSKSIAYFVRFDKFWLDLCYVSGVEFITKKLLDQNASVDKKINFYTVNATIPEEVKKCMHQIFKDVL